MTELYALTRTAKENLETQIQNKTSETREKFPTKEDLGTYTSPNQSTQLTLTQADIDYMLDDVDGYFTETKVFHNDYIAIVVGPQYTTLNLPKTIEHVYLGARQTSIWNDTFAHMKNLKTVVGKNINNIGVRAFYNSSIERFCVTRPRGETFTLNDLAFSGCSNLHTVELDVDLSYIPTECFSDCHALRSFKIYRPELLNKMYYRCFANCYELEYIIGLDKVRFNALDYDCFVNSGLIYVGISGSFNIGMHSTGPIIRNLNDLKEFYINLSEINYHLAEGTPNLEYFRIGSAATVLSERIMKSYACPNLIWIDCNYPNLQSDSDGFNPDLCDFETLRMVTIRNTGYTVIPTYSFKYNNSMTTLYIPPHVNKINVNAVNNNDNLEFVVCHAGLNIGDLTNPFGVVKKRILVTPVNGNAVGFVRQLQDLYGVDKVKPLTLYDL